VTGCHENCKKPQFSRQPVIRICDLGSLHLRWARNGPGGPLGSPPFAPQRGAHFGLGARAKSVMKIAKNAIFTPDFEGRQPPSAAGVPAGAGDGSGKKTTPKTFFSRHANGCKGLKAQQPLALFQIQRGS